jgi:acetyl-CoA/propionyl-CoA carboxylase biotin carboxyl carrier protein
VYAPQDRDALHVRVADQAFALPGSTPAETYLNVDAVVAAALRSGARAVHPGYGFLAESASLARAVADAGLAWIGPPPEALEEVSNKLSARRLAERAGAPLIPATAGPVENADAVVEFAGGCGYPVVVKAAYGGGGRGMRVVRDASEAGEALAACRREALAAFGRDECFAERFLERPRHVETQCLADAHGDVAVVSTRDCTVQRRHQKLVEEAPAPFLTAAQTEALRSASRMLLLAAGYQGAATCEFLIAQDGAVNFMEVNPRLQVEHPVTEEVTGVDLVLEQFRIAAGEPLGFGDLEPRGHAIEFRINAEDPAAGFLPAPGTLTGLRLPGGPGVRCDFGYEAGDTLTGEFDSMVGKVVVSGRDRAEALSRSRRALRELKVEGLATVRDFHRAVVEAPEFAAQDTDDFRVHTRWIEEEFADALAALPPASRHADPAGAPEAAPTTRMVVEVGGKRLEVVLPAELAGGLAAAGPAGAAPPAPQPRRAAPRGGGTASGASADGAVAAPMRGTVVRLAAAEGDRVAAGDLLVVLEAMKMEQPLTAPRAGTVRHLDVAPGDQVATGQVLCVVEP